MGGADWILLARDRGPWRDVTNTALKRRVSLTVWNSEELGRITSIKKDSVSCSKLVR